MDLKQILIGIVLLVAAVGAACSEVSFEEEYVKINSTDTIELSVENDCNSPQEYVLTLKSDLPLKASKNSFSLHPGTTQVIEVEMNPQFVETGFYTITATVSGDATYEAEAIVKVEESGIFEFKYVGEVMRVREHDSIELLIGLENKAGFGLTNVLLIAESEGEELGIAGPVNIGPGVTVSQALSIENVGLGEHDINLKAYAGEFFGIKNFKLIVVPTDEPIDATIFVEGYEGKGYVLSYKVKNVGTTTLNDLYVTVQDAPEVWEVISPSAFDLEVGEQKEVEVILLHNGMRVDTVTVGLFEGAALLAEDQIDLARGIAGPTGLIGFGSSFEFGIVVVLIFVVVYFGWKYKEKKEAEEAESEAQHI